jgi:hypothetical protein
VASVGSDWDGHTARVAGIVRVIVVTVLWPLRSRRSAPVDGGLRTGVLGLRP